MKNKTLLAIAIAGLALTACKKDRTCECTTTSSYASTSTPTGGTTTTNSSIDPPSTSTVKYKKVKKSDLGTLCGDQKYTSNGSYTSQNSTGTSTSTDETKCKLK